MDYKKVVNIFTEKIKHLKSTNRKTIIAVGAVIIVLILVISIVSLFSSSPEKAIKNIFNSYKNAEMFNQPDIDPKIISVITDNFSYDIVSVSEDEDSAVVTTEIRAINMKNVITEVMKEMLNSDNPSEYGENEISATMLKALENEVETVTTMVDIKVIKENGRWHAQPDDALIDAVFGGMNSALENLK